jgi:alkyl hydroperoxide reductase subunit AhpC
VIPQLRDWHTRYAGQGLVVVGVHTPEFFWEGPHDRVADAVRRLDVPYPVVQDNDTAIWKRFGVRAWPTTVMIDRRGRIRHTHIGEGGGAEMERVLRALLTESDG